VRLILPVPPSWNRSYRAGKGRFYTPQNVLDFRTSVAYRVKLARIRAFPRETKVCVSLWWYRARQAGDLDKRVSVCLDALQAGVWYQDDAQVSELHCYRLEDKLNPRLEVEVTAIALGKVA
jgi:Holliday junction resolvase RusA-like endonuclease